MCPLLAFTVYSPRPRKPSMVRAFAGDSTITSGFATLPSLPDPRRRSFGPFPSRLEGKRICRVLRPRGCERLIRGPTGAPFGPRCCHGRQGRVKTAVHRTLRSLAYAAPVVLGLSITDPKSIFDSLSPYGEIGLWLIVFAETGLLIGFFLPGDSLLFTAGLLASQGHLDIALVVIGAFVAAFVGSEVGYTIGERLGPRLFRRPDSRLFKQEYVDRTKGFFDRHG